MKKIRPQTTLLGRPIVTAGAHVFQLLSSSVLRPLWKEVVCPIVLAIYHLHQVTVQTFLNFNLWIRATFGPRLHIHHPSPAISLEEIREDSHIPPESNSSSHSNDPSPHETNPPLTPEADTSHDETDPPTIDADLPRHNTNSPSQETSSSYLDTPTPTSDDAELRPVREDLITVQEANVRLLNAELFVLVREGRTTIQEANVKNIRCVSWILRNITDPEALDAAIRLAGTIRWFEDGIEAEAPYIVIVSIFYSCLDSYGIVYPGSRDRAYYSAWAILWIHIRAMCVSEEFAKILPLPSTRNHISYDLDLYLLLGMYEVAGPTAFVSYTNIFMELNTPTHMQWASNAFLHFCWTGQGNPDVLGQVFAHYDVAVFPWDTIPLDAILNLFLVWSIYLGHPVEEEMLKIQDKVYVISRSLLRIT